MLHKISRIPKHSEFRYPNGSQLAKMKKKVFLLCYCHEIYRVEAVGLTKLQLYLKNEFFGEYFKFGAIS